LAYTLIDINEQAADSLINRLGAIQGVLAVRAL